LSHTVNSAERIQSNLCAAVPNVTQISSSSASGMVNVLFVAVNNTAAAADTFEGEN
jgi:hypothetical protein